MSILDFCPHARNVQICDFLVGRKSALPTPVLTVIIPKNEKALETSNRHDGTFDGADDNNNFFVFLLMHWCP